MAYYGRNDITLGGFLERFCFRLGMILQITFFFFLVATFFIVEDSEFIDVGFNLV
jgi:hypothetical protein